MSASISSRSELATLFSALKRVRPTVPFWRLAAHRIPTLWCLYRGLLRSTSAHEYINWRLRLLFHSHRHLTSPQKTRIQLEKAHKWLDIFQKAEKGDAHYQRLMDRYDRLIAMRVDRENWERIFNREMEWSHKMKNRAILTGTIVRPTIYNRPFPRMKPQPIHVSRMIHKRRKARQRRGERQEELLEYKDYVKQERAFEDGLRVGGVEFKPVFDPLYEWLQPLDAALNELQTSYKLDDARSKTLPSATLLAQVKEARREKVRNKTRERERERRGEVLECTLRRMRKGPPAHVLAMMSSEERRRDRWVRARAGLRRGVKEEEEGEDERREVVDRLEREFEALSEVRRRTNDEAS